MSGYAKSETRSVFESDFFEHSADIGINLFKILFTGLFTGEDDEFPGQIQALPIQSHGFPEKPFEVVSFHGDAGLFRDEDPEFEFFGRFPDEGKEIPREPSAVFHKSGDFGPTFQTEAAGKFISFGQL